MWTLVGMQVQPQHTQSQCYTQLDGELHASADLPSDTHCMEYCPGPRANLNSVHKRDVSASLWTRTLILAGPVHNAVTTLTELPSMYDIF
jgi:hypothetical protein